VPDIIKTPANTKTNWEQEKPIANPITNLGVNKQVFGEGGFADLK
jgi:hypothetical protein